MKCETRLHQSTLGGEIDLTNESVVGPAMLNGDFILFLLIVMFVIVIYISINFIDFKMDDFINF